MTIERLFLSLSMLSFSVMANDTAQWVTGVNSTSIDEFKTSDPTELPNYPTTSTGNEAYLGNEVGMANDAATQATTDEGAQLIHGIPARPNVNNEQWYQNAQDVTANPSDYVDTVDADYTDCEEVTQEGDEYTETQACTVSRIGSTATCSQGRLLEVDANYLYTCNKELGSSNGNCSIGREINVTQSHTYSCEAGEKTRLKDCTDTLNVTVEWEQGKEFVQVVKPCPDNLIGHDKCIEEPTWIKRYWRSFLVDSYAFADWDSTASLWYIRVTTPNGTYEHWEDGSYEEGLNKQYKIEGWTWPRFLGRDQVANDTVYPTGQYLVVKIAEFKEKSLTRAQGVTVPRWYDHYAVYISTVLTPSDDDPVRDCPTTYDTISVGGIERQVASDPLCYNRIVPQEPTIVEQWEKTCN